jgi:hypothetical protein
MFRIRVPSLLRILPLAVLAGMLPACDTDGPGKVGYNHAGPTHPLPATIVTVTSDRGSLEVGGTNFARITVTAVNPATGAPVPDLTEALLTTTAGNLGSQSGEQEIVLELVNGVATTALFAGSEAALATVRAQVGSGVGFVTVRMSCPPEGCGGGGEGFWD